MLSLPQAPSTVLLGFRAFAASIGVGIVPISATSAGRICWGEYPGAATIFLPPVLNFSLPSRKPLRFPMFRWVHSGPDAQSTNLLRDPARVRTAKNLQRRLNTKAAVAEIIIRDQGVDSYLSTMRVDSEQKEMSADYLGGAIVSAVERGTIGHEDVARLLLFASGVAEMSLHGLSEKHAFERESFHASLAFEAAALSELAALSHEEGGRERDDHLMRIRAAHFWGMGEEGMWGLERGILHLWRRGFEGLFEAGADQLYSDLLKKASQEMRQTPRVAREWDLRRIGFLLEGAARSADGRIDRSQWRQATRLLGMTRSLPGWEPDERKNLDRIIQDCRDASI